MENVNRDSVPPESALLLIDLQRDFLSDDGRMPVARNQVAQLIDAANAAVARFRASGQPIVAIGNEFRRSDLIMNLLRRNACLAGSVGAMWDTRVPISNAQYFPKWATDAFCNPALEPWLRERHVKTLIVTGLMASACVTATAKSALHRGFAVRLIEDAIACSSDRSKLRAIARLQRRGAASLQA
jgi:nicotinamidase-related amidase